MSFNEQKRREKRTPAPNVGLVELEVLTRQGTSKSVGRSLLYDQSKHGLSVILDFSIPPGTKLALKNRYVSYRGVVRHCQKLDLGYKVGLALQS
jgi:hypothetical protein